jgi:hypothetical protein
MRTLVVSVWAPRFSALSSGQVQMSHQSLLEDRNLVERYAHQGSPRSHRETRVPMLRELN